MESVGQIFCTSTPPFDMQQSISTMPAENINRFSHQFPDRPLENWWESHESEEENSSTDEDDDHVLERFLRKLDANGREMVKKLVAKVERDVPFEQVFGETWHHFPEKTASRMLEKIKRKMGAERDGGFVRRERGLDGDGLQGELKNERFKVKTMNIIVKEEKEQ